jgi:CPA2 family monovalent cation:H+ antiporter-2
VVKLHYSIALGAFLIGAIIAESRHVRLIERLVQPVRDLFSAIFFVTIGLMLDPRVLVQYAVPIAVITVTVIIGKILTCGLGTFVAGNDARTSMRVGMGLAQIGEFSFIIAALGVSLKVTSSFLYPIAVAVSALTTLTTPYLIRAADPLTRHLAAHVPAPIARVCNLYGQWLRSLSPGPKKSMLLQMVRRAVLQIGINLALVAAIFLGSACLAPSAEQWLSELIPYARIRQALCWGLALILSLPFLVAVYRKLKVLSLLLADISVQPASAGRFTRHIRRAMAEAVPAFAMMGIFILLVALSGRILPPTDLLIVFLTTAAVLSWLLWRWFVRVHARLQIALQETLGEESD